MSAPLAYFLSWTCYGTRLHGDERGSTDREHNQLGAPLIVPDAARESRGRHRMKGQPFTLVADARTIVERTLLEHCGFRGWKPHARAARTTHVHIIVSGAYPVAPEDVMNQFKGWCTRRLRKAGLATADAPVWTEHGVTRWINNYEGLVAAVDYVSRLQDLPERFERNRARG